MWSTERAIKKLQVCSLPTTQTKLAGKHFGQLIQMMLGMTQL